MRFLVFFFYVDDLLITGRSGEKIDKFKKDMMQAFEMYDLCLRTYFLEWRLQKI